MKVAMTAIYLLFALAVNAAAVGLHCCQIVRLYKMKLTVNWFLAQQVPDAEGDIGARAVDDRFLEVSVSLSPLRYWIRLLGLSLCLP